MTLWSLDHENVVGLTATAVLGHRPQSLSVVPHLPDEIA
jgi:hypothetical protein